MQARDFSPQNNNPRFTNHTLMKIFSLAVLLFFLFAGGATLYAYSKINKPLTFTSHEQNFIIEKGEGVSAVAGKLQQQRLISSAFVFKVYAILKNSTGQLQAGTYVLNSNQTLKEIFEKLTTGQALSDEVKITFIEGDTVKDYATRLADKGLGSAQDFLLAQKNFSKVSNFAFLSDRPVGRDLEGYLFPDTYMFSKRSSSEEIIVKLLENFGSKLKPELLQEIGRQNKSVFEIVTMASLVEGEVGRNVKEGTKLSAIELDKVSTERRLVAGVFYNRLRIGQALQSDVTVNYITGKKMSQASATDIKLDNPYNTYVYKGLPPGPINNPSLDSIMAAIYPTASEYFYFLSKPSGETVFAKTLEEHNQNKAKYLP